MNPYLLHNYSDEMHFMASTHTSAMPAWCRRKLNKWETENHKYAMERLREKRRQRSGWSQRKIFPDEPAQSMSDFQLAILADRARVQTGDAIQAMLGLSRRMTSKEELILVKDELLEIEAQAQEAWELSQEQTRRSAATKKGGEKENVAPKAVPKAKRPRQRVEKNKSSRAPALGDKAARRVETRAERGVGAKKDTKRR